MTTLYRPDINLSKGAPQAIAVGGRGKADGEMRVAVLRPEPGNAATAARLEALGLETLRLPLFAVAPLAWTAPDPAKFDALLLTSANAVRHAGAALRSLATLPVVAVGDATAAAARAAGLRVALTGDGDGARAVAPALAAGYRRLLHLAGRDRADELPVAVTIAVYASDSVAIAPAAIDALAGTLALLHSRRAARRFAELVDTAGIARGSITLAALSPAVADAAGDGWSKAIAAQAPNDTALVALAAHIANEGSQA